MRLELKFVQLSLKHIRNIHDYRNIDESLANVVIDFITDL